MMFAGWRKIIIFYSVVVASCIFSSPIMAKTLKNCDAVGDPNNLTVYEFYGEAEHDHFGTGLDSAGDFDGDGVVDLIVGSLYSDAGAADGGAAYLFLGGASADSNWDFRLLAEAAADQLGYAVAGVGDLDNDGFDDIAIGARNNDRSGPDIGAVWVIFGSKSPFGNRQIVLAGDSGGPKGFGHSLAGGDFNGDGFSDLVVGAPLDVVFSPSDFKLGKVYIFFGGTSFNPTTPDIVLQAEHLFHEFGYSIANAGDLNNDGYDDLIVGAHFYGSTLYSPEQNGRAYIYFGGNPMNTTPDIILTGEGDYCWLGHSVAGAGDINGDGFDDALIGSPYYPGGLDGNPGWGKAYVLFGANSLDMDNIPDVEFVGYDTYDQLGWDVDGGLDMNKDGFDDIILGARYHDCPVEEGGAAYVYYGGNSIDVNNPTISASSSQTWDIFGSSVAMIGEWSDSMPLAAGAAIWNDKGMDVNNPMTEGAFGAVFAFTSPACILGDFNRDSLVDWTDLGIFTRHWLDTSCDDLNWCGEADMDHNTKVNFGDFALITDRWLQGCN